MNQEHTKEELDEAVDWLFNRLPKERTKVRQEHPDWTREQVATEAIRRLG